MQYSILSVVFSCVGYVQTLLQARRCCEVPCQLLPLKELVKGLLFTYLYLSKGGGKSCQRTPPLQTLFFLPPLVCSTLTTTSTSSHPCCQRKIHRENPAYKMYISKSTKHNLFFYYTLYYSTFFFFIEVKRNLYFYCGRWLNTELSLKLASWNDLLSGWCLLRSYKII